MTDVSGCLGEGRPLVCRVRVEHTLVAGADSYRIDGPGTWIASCGGDDDCTIVFPINDPPRQCTFTIRAVRNGNPGPASEPFCVPG